LISFWDQFNKGNHSDLHWCLGYSNLPSVEEFQQKFYKEFLKVEG
jgi:hypothetical protein